MRIILDATLRTDFDTCINLFQDFIKQCGNTHTSQQLQEVQLAGFASNLAVAKSAQVEDQYYKKHEYEALSPEQKKILHEMHEQ